MTDSPTEHTEGLLRIGEVARLFNLSVGTLRHYEQMGLLDPAHIDPASGYRYYGSRQLSTLNTISHLRVLDLPLAQIREFFDHARCGPYTATAGSAAGAHRAQAPRAGARVAQDR